MQTEFYKKYMRSEKWQQKKAERLIVDENKCAMCRRPADKCRNGLQCHHVNYQNLGNENVLEDLVSLCGSCHKKLHNFYNRRRA